MSSREPWTVALAESGQLPDSVIRFGIRRLLRGRLAEQAAGDPFLAAERLASFADALREAPIALRPERANDQHYEVPPAFFREVLGPRLKYSCALFDGPEDTLRGAEDRMLDLTCQRAGIEDGMRVLDLGCGWGSLSLWIAEHYPTCRVVSVSNSKPQREHILGECDRLGHDRIEVVTADVNDFQPEGRFDRVVSIEMFEHVRNWGALFERISSWLQPDGQAFLHFFCHRDVAYPYEDRGDGDWMTRHFFTGGIMPADSMPYLFSEALRVDRHWRVDGKHYARTADAWLARLDERRDAILPVLADCYGQDEAEHWFQRWRLFFLAVSELFGFRSGREWWVAHYRLVPQVRS